MVRKDDFRFGVIWQDFQHGQLIELMDKLERLSDRQNEKELFKYTVAFLVMYANHHFSLEEEYMNRYGYFDTAYHTAEHKKFVQRLKTFRSHHADYTPEALADLVADIRTWIKTHILGNDRKLAEFILTKEKKIKARKLQP